MVDFRLVVTMICRYDRIVLLQDTETDRAKSPDGWSVFDIRTGEVTIPAASPLSLIILVSLSKMNKKGTR